MNLKKYNIFVSKGSVKENCFVDYYKFEQKAKTIGQTYLKNENEQSYRCEHFTKENAYMRHSLRKNAYIPLETLS